MASKENNTPMAVFAITERGDKSYWTKIGVAIVANGKCASRTIPDVNAPP